MVETWSSGPDIVGKGVIDKSGTSVSLWLWVLMSYKDVMACKCSGSVLIHSLQQPDNTSIIIIFGQRMTTEKGDTPPTMVEDKSIPERSGSVHSVSAGGATTVQEESFLTRNGLNLTSFKKRHYGNGIVELDRPMKPRHLNMIAIGGAIGAGFFVGSGKAFSSGVSERSSVLPNFCLSFNRSALKPTD